MAMKKYWVILSIAVLAAGCASASTLPTTSDALSGNQEGRVSNLLVGAWNGYIKDPRGVTIIFRTPTLQIFRVKRTADGGWFIDLHLNGKKVDAELTVSDIVVRVEFAELYANLMIYHRLDLYKDRHLIGKIWYGRNNNPAEVTFEKTY